MARWLRFEREGAVGFGRIDGAIAALPDDPVIAICDGEMFGAWHLTGERIALHSVRLLPPCQPRKLIGLWNNFHALATKLGQSVPTEPLYFIKAASSYAGHGDDIRPPPSYDGKVFYEGELGIVIGRRTDGNEGGGDDQAIFGYTCVNDVTAFDLIARDPSFAQWTRAKSFDTVGVFGPWIATDADIANASVITRVGGRERQNYPVADMIFSPSEIVRLIARDMTLEPGDVIACGTSIGALPMREGNEIEIEVTGVGVLKNVYRSARSA